MDGRSNFLTSQKFIGVVNAVLLSSLVLMGGAFFLGDFIMKSTANVLAIPVAQAQSDEPAAPTAETQRLSESELVETELLGTELLESELEEDNTEDEAAGESTTRVDDDSARVAQVQAAPVLAQPFQRSALSYSGDVFAVDEVPVAVEVIGQVLQLNVGVGDAVEAGDLLLEIDSTTLKAQRAQALAGLQAAEAQLRGLQLEPEESDIEAAKAGLAAARAAYNRAVEGPTPEDLNIAEAQMRQAEALVKQAQAAYNEIRWMPQIAMMPQSLQLEQATLQFEAAKSQYEKATQGATQDVISGAYAQIASAEAQLDRLLKGANEPQIDAVRAQVRQAETGLLLSDIQVNKATVRAPITGVINQVNTSVGANVAPGGAIFEILSNDAKVVIHVDEVRRGDVYVGQPATIQVNAYGDRLFEAEVATIAPALDPSTRTFEVTVIPTGDANELAPGMFATVELGQ